MATTMLTLASTNENLFHSDMFQTHNEDKSIVSIDTGLSLEQQITLDNLLSQEEEPEDIILASFVQRMLTLAQQETPSPDWEQEFNELWESD